MSVRTFAAGVLVEEWDDATRTYRGAVVRPYTAEESAVLDAAVLDAGHRATRDALLARVDAAIQADLDYLALDPPTTAQVVAQVGRLTRQVVALLRLVGGRLDDTSGT